jgi:monoamine oxidase
VAHDCDAVVVGGGFAGVTAARELDASGLRTVLLEGRDRLGGRTWTSSFAGKRIEMGGTWLHWLQPHVWAELTRHGIPLVEDPAAETYILADGEGLGRFSREEAVPRLRELAERYFDGAREVMDQPYDPLLRREEIEPLDQLSLRDRIDRLSFTPAEQDWLTGWLSQQAGNLTSAGAFTAMLRWWALSGWDYGLCLDALARYRPEGGMIGVLEAMLVPGGIEVRLDNAVARIEAGNNGVEATTRSGEVFRASVAVIAVPVALWPHIEFVPALSPLRLEAAAEGLATAHGSKAWVRVRGDVERIYAQPPEGYPFTVVYTHAVLDDSQVLGCFSGEPSLDVTNVDQVTAAIETLLPDAEIVETKAHDWNADEFSRAGWPFMLPGQLTRYLTELQEPSGRVAFATSDIASGWCGFIDGAVESGLRAARQARAIHG